MPGPTVCRIRIRPTHLALGALDHARSCLIMPGTFLLIIPGTYPMIAGDCLDPAPRELGRGPSTAVRRHIVMHCYSEARRHGLQWRMDSHFTGAADSRHENVASETPSMSSAVTASRDAGDWLPRARILPPWEHSARLLSTARSAVGSTPLRRVGVHSTAGEPCRLY